MVNSPSIKAAIAAVLTPPGTPTRFFWYLLPWTNLVLDHLTYALPTATFVFNPPFPCPSPSMINDICVCSTICGDLF